MASTTGSVVSAGGAEDGTSDPELPSLLGGEVGATGGVTSGGGVTLGVTGGETDVVPGGVTGVGATVVGVTLEVAGGFGVDGDAGGFGVGVTLGLGVGSVVFVGVEVPGASVVPQPATAKTRAQKE